MGEDRVVTDYEVLDRVLVALGEGVADRMSAPAPSRSRALTIRQAVRAALLEPPDPVDETTLPRGVSLEVALRGTLRHFLPGATAVVLTAFALSLLLNPFERGTTLPALGVLLSATSGFGAMLLGLRRRLFPHANPDGHASDVAGIAAPLATFGLGMGLYALAGPLAGVNELLMMFGLAFASGGVAAAVTYAPWLIPTLRVGRPSPLNRWSKLRATVATGVAGAGVFSAATVLQGALLMVAGSFPPPGMGLLEVLPIVLWQGGSTGFLIGMVFAVLLAALYARVAVERLHAWRVGLLGALGGAVPYWTWVGMRLLSGTPLFDDPLTTIARVSLTWAVPGFVLACGSVKLAQRSARGDGQLRRSGSRP